MSATHVDLPGWDPWPDRGERRAPAYLQPRTDDWRRLIDLVDEIVLDGQICTITLEQYRSRHGWPS